MARGRSGIRVRARGMNSDRSIARRYRNTTGKGALAPRQAKHQDLGREASLKFAPLSRLKSSLEPTGTSRRTFACGF